MMNVRVKIKVCLYAKKEKKKKIKVWWLELHMSVNWEVEGHEVQNGGHILNYNYLPGRSQGNNILFEGVNAL